MTPLPLQKVVILCIKYSQFHKTAQFSQIKSDLTPIKFTTSSASSFLLLSQNSRDQKILLLLLENFILINSSCKERDEKWSIDLESGKCLVRFWWRQFSINSQERWRWRAGRADLWRHGEGPPGNFLGKFWRCTSVVDGHRAMSYFRSWYRIFIFLNVSFLFFNESDHI